MAASVRFGPAGIAKRADPTPQARESSATREDGQGGAVGKVRTRWWVLRTAASSAATSVAQEGAA